MWFIIAVGITFAVILLVAAFVDWRTRRSGRRPASAGSISDHVRAYRRETWRTRLRGTKFEQLFTDPAADPKPRPGEARYGSPQGVYAAPKKKKREHEDYRD